MKEETQGLSPEPSLSRRDFAVVTAATVAGVATSAEAQAAVTETDVSVTTPDGSCDCALFHPSAAGTYPGVVMYPDALGLRPVFRDMGRRMAAAGYTVLVVNSFYRTRKAPVLDGAFDFNNPADRAKLTELRGPMTTAAVTRDAVAFVGYLDGHARVKKSAKIGTNGYCMGGPLTMRTAAAIPARVGAACSFHGGGLVTQDADSPHLLVPKMKVSYYFGVADNDDKAQPTAKTVLKDTFAASGLPAKIEVYEGAMHGWCVKGSAVYNEAAAERAWTEMMNLYKATLV